MKQALKDLAKEMFAVHKEEVFLVTTDNQFFPVSNPTVPKSHQDALNAISGKNDQILRITPADLELASNEEIEAEEAERIAEEEAAKKAEEEAAATKAEEETAAKKAEEEAAAKKAEEEAAAKKADEEATRAEVKTESPAAESQVPVADDAKAKSAKASKK